MGAITLQDVERRVAELAARIHASGHQLPTFGYSEDLARPHIEVDRQGVHYVVVERDIELKRVTSQNVDEILWHVFEAVTFSLASDYELAHRQDRKDSRRIIFARQLELLNTLTSEWAQRQAEHHRAILQEHPFDDYSSPRVALTVQLRNAGCSDDEAWRRACERYPLPSRG